MNSVWKFLCEEDGPTAVEYAVMLAMILVAALAGISAFGQATADSFQNSQDSISSAMSGS